MEVLLRIMLPTIVIMSFVSLELNKHQVHDIILSVYLLRYTDNGCMTRLFHYWFYIDNIDSTKRTHPCASGQPRQRAGSQPPIHHFMVTTPSARGMTLNIPSPII